MRKKPHQGPDGNRESASTSSLESIGSWENGYVIVASLVGYSLGLNPVDQPRNPCLGPSPFYEIYAEPGRRKTFIPATCPEPTRAVYSRVACE